MFKWLIICLLFAPGWATSFANDLGSGMVAAGASGAAYWACRQLIKAKYSCILPSIITTEFIMLLNLSTSDSDEVLRQKFLVHTIGASIAIPIAILE
jgi:hypothetical protein